MTHEQLPSPETAVPLADVVGMHNEASRLLDGLGYELSGDQDTGAVGTIEVAFPSDEIEDPIVEIKRTEVFGNTLTILHVISANSELTEGTQVVMDDKRLDIHSDPANGDELNDYTYKESQISFKDGERVSVPTSFAADLDIKMDPEAEDEDDIGVLVKRANEHYHAAKTGVLSQLEPKLTQPKLTALLGVLRGLKPEDRQVDVGIEFDSLHV